MKLVIIGLGNPGRSYLNSPHNAGFIFADVIADILGVTFKKRFLKPYEIASAVINGNSIYIVKPLTYMNRSGEIISDVLKKTGADYTDLLIICDTLDLPFAKNRFKKKGGSAGHNGLASIHSFLGDFQFKRLYAGVGRPEDKSEVVQYVLKPMSVKRYSEFVSSAAETSDILLTFFDKPLDKVINEINKS